jgi:hypothetical protein
MKQTPMQDLREDLILTQTSAKEALLEIENQETRKACQEVVRLTLSNIIKRIDEELLEMEKQQKDSFAIEFGEWLCEKANVPYIKGTMDKTLEIFKNK